MITAKTRQQTKEIVMKITAKFLVFFMLATTLVEAQNLRSTMRTLNRSFREVNSYARSGNNGPQAIEKIIQMREAASESLKYLPRGINPSDSDSVERYNAIMTELVDKIIELEVVFATSPLNKNQAQDILKEINSIRRKGHSLFK